LRGIDCSDGTYTSLTRLINDGTGTSTWTFSRDTVAGTTTVTFPQLPYDSAPNQTVYTFTNGLITSEKAYEGSAGGTLLREADTSYATNNTPAATNVTIGSRTSRVETDLDSLGNLNGLREFDWGTPGSGAAGSAIRSATFTYLPDNGLNMV